MEKIGSFGVDSGQIIIGDPCYLDGWKNEQEEGGEFSASLSAPYPYSYNGASSATCSKKMGGELGRGSAVAVTSGYGDGYYPVYVERDYSGRIVKVIIDFVGEVEEEEQCIDCGYTDCDGDCTTEEESTEDDE